MNRIISTDPEACFAKMPLGECKALYTGRHKNRCSGVEGCKFFKSVADMAASEKAKMERLKTLPEEHQYFIADKYYSGKMPWKDDD